MRGPAAAVHSRSALSESSSVRISHPHPRRDEQQAAAAPIAAPRAWLRRMTLAAGGFLHPCLLGPLAFCPSRTSFLHSRTLSPASDTLALYSPPSSSILHSSAPPADLLRPHFSAPASFLAKGVRDSIDTSSIEIESADGSVDVHDDAQDIFKWRPADSTQRVLVPEGGASAEQQVSQALESVTFQPWRKYDSSSDSFGKPLQRMYKPQDIAFRALRTKVDRWINPSIRKSGEEDEVDAVQRAEQDGEVSERDGEEAESSATREIGRSSSTAVPLANVAGARYQRLPINLDLQLYWARILRQRGHQDQAVALLKQVVSSLPSQTT